MKRQIFYTGCVIIILSALVTLYTAAQNEYILEPAQLFVTILPAIYVASLMWELKFVLLFAQVLLNWCSMIYMIISSSSVLSFKSV